MRSNTDQAVGLDRVARLVMAAGCNCLMNVRAEGDRHDVSVLVAAGPTDASEVVYAAGGYDIWKAGGTGLVGTDLSAETAAQTIINEYRKWKAGFNK